MYRYLTLFSLLLTLWTGGAHADLIRLDTFSKKIGYDRPYVGVYCDDKTGVYVYTTSSGIDTVPLADLSCIPTPHMQADLGWRVIHERITGGASSAVLCDDRRQVLVYYYVGTVSVQFAPTVCGKK
jgi:hypothetical protein